MAYDYESIKALAKDLGTSVKQLIALAPQNDPFYVGTAGDIEKGRWFFHIWQRAGYTTGVHLRRVHYWTVSQTPPILMPDGKPYENTQECWSFLTQAAKLARYLELVPIENIADHKNPDPVVNARYEHLAPGYWIETFQLADPYVTTRGIENTEAQPYHIEIWCEKSTMNDVLLPVCNRYNANLATFEGEASITACYRLIKRIDNSNGKPTRIFYISDFDPAGNSMPVATARKIEYLLGHYNRAYDVKLKPIVLTADQVKTYQLPRTPIKKSERRAANFEAAFGTGAVELDALEALYPGTLGDIVSAELASYYNQEAADLTRQRRRELEQAIDDQVKAITARYEAEIEALQSMINELQGIEIDASQYAVERFEPHVNENANDWLFDSLRPYVEQIQQYKAHKGQGSDLDAA